MDSINEYVYVDSDNCLNLLHLAAGLDFDYREEVIELLISMDADLNFPGQSEGVEDMTALHIAAMWGYKSTIILLLAHEADASLVAANSLTPVDYATIFEHFACTSLLIRYGLISASGIYEDFVLGDEKEPQVKKEQERNNEADSTLKDNSLEQAEEQW